MNTRNVFQGASFTNKKYGWKDPLFSEEDDIREEGAKWDNLGEVNFHRVRDSFPSKRTPYQSADVHNVDIFLTSIQKRMGNRLLTAYEERRIGWIVQLCARKAEQLLNTQKTMEAKKASSKDIKRICALKNAVSKTFFFYRNLFVEYNLRFVFAVAKQYGSKGLSYGDLLQAGMAGLLRAAECFDPKKKFKFSTYAGWRIHQGISRSLLENRTVKIPVYVLERRRQVFLTVKNFKMEHGRPPTISEIQAKTKFSKESIIAVFQSANPNLSLDVSAEEPGDEFVDILEDDSRFHPDAIREACDGKKDIHDALGILTDRERDIVKKRFGIGDKEESTLHVIGEEYGLTLERIRQIEKSALKKLRNHSVFGPLLKSYLTNS